ncbi:LD-carboxypeptidase [bacterium]|nr:MAG: LD-carboxypeptidase [bacterium]
MNRRNLLKISALSTLFFLNKGIDLSAKTNSNAILRPKRLEKGEKVALISPASNVTDPLDIFKAQEICDKLGVNPIMPKSIAKTSSGYKTRSVEDRVAEIHRAFEDSSVKAIFCIRGGFGSAELLDSLDYNLIRNNPKIICGYSDITALLNAIYKNTGLVTFHSPVMLSNFDEISYNSFVKMITIDKPYGIIQNPNTGIIRETYPTITINQGVSQGQLIGGNLSLITSLIGTPFQIETKDKLLFIEDVEEAPYRLERMLIQMKQAGLLRDLKGVVIGKCNECIAGSSQSSWDRSELEVYNYIFDGMDYPVFYGLLLGHTSTQFTIPIGINSEIDATNGTLNILESAVI